MSRERSLLLEDDLRRLRVEAGTDRTRWKTTWVAVLVAFGLFLPLFREHALEALGVFALSVGTTVLILDSPWSRRRLRPWMDRREAGVDDAFGCQPQRGASRPERSR